ncbi:MAG: MBL fold metallo-hydrolase [Phycisphaeraceae bacterium]
MNQAHVRITTLVENTAGGRGTLGEHGLAFWIETPAGCALFDTGQTAEVLVHNARRLGADLARAEAVVLSHGHYDHTGGLAEVLRRTGDVRLRLHPAALARRFSQSATGEVREVGMPAELDEAALTSLAGAICWTERPAEVLPGLRVTGPIPRETDFEDTGGRFFLDAECRRPDPIEDDQALFFAGEAGTVVLLGCAHAGVVNTLRYVRRLTGAAPIQAVIGGMHLLHASGHRLEQTLQALEEFDVRQIAPGHCTGGPASALLWGHFPERWRACTVGSRFTFACRKEDRDELR